MSLCAQELLSRLSAARTASAAQLPPQQEAAWDLWAWDQQRACRAVDAAPRPPGSSPQTGPTLVAQDVPCNWQLGFVCVQQEEEQVVGTSPSSASATAWYLRHRDALALPAASPHVGGPGGSGLELAVSGQVAGMVQPPGVVTVAFDDSQRFWEQGPVVSFLFRWASCAVLSKPQQISEVAVATCRADTNLVQRRRYLVQTKRKDAGSWCCKRRGRRS